MPDAVNFNFEAAFEKLGGRMDVMNEKFTSIDQKIDANHKLMNAELVPMKNDIEELKKDTGHCSTSIKANSEAFAAQIKALDAKIAVDPAARAQIEARHDEVVKRLEAVERARGEDVAVQNSTRAWLKGAWGAVLALGASAISGAVILAVQHH